jgi:hypothetical protein
MCATGLYSTRNQSRNMFAPKNQVTGSSKAMGPGTGVEMMIDAVAKYNVIYSTNICDDDSTIRAVYKWSYKELLKLQASFQWPRTLIGLKKSDKGCFPLNAPKPKFCLTHPTAECRSYSALNF